MIRKISLTLVLLLACSFNLSAQEAETHYIGLQGSWWNAAYAGEGFAIEEYGDGFVIVYWYTYDESGEQMWLMGTGERDGNTVVLNMFRTHGGALADPANPDLVSEVPWGTVTLDIEECTHIGMTFESLSGQSGGYALTRLLRTPHAAGSCNAILIEPPEQPPETDPPEGTPPDPDPEPEAPPPSIRLQKRSATGGWDDVEPPFEGLAVIHKTYVGDPERITLFRFRLIVEEGDMTIGSVTATEPTGISQPSVEGLTPGMTFPEGSIIDFRLNSNTTGGVRVYPHYNVWIENFGEVVNLTVRLSTQTQ